MSYCTLCKSGSYLLNNTCISSGPQEYWANNDANRCDPCLDNCENFQNEYTCDLCKENYYWYEDACSQSCPSGFWKNTQTRKCEQCSQICAECSALTTCTACHEGTYLSGGTCSANCPESTWRNNQTRVCDNCQDGCQKCETEASCDLCKSQYFWNGTGCSRDCPDNTEKDPANRNCVPIEITSGLKTTAVIMQASVTTALASSSIAAVVSEGNPTLLWGLMNLCQDCFYLLFLNIEYPQSLNYFLEMFSVGRLRFMPNF